MSMGSNPEDLQYKRKGLKVEQGQQSRRIAALRKECKTALIGVWRCVQEKKMGTQPEECASEGKKKKKMGTQPEECASKCRKRTGTQLKECEMLASKEWERQMQR